MLIFPFSNLHVGDIFEIKEKGLYQKINISEGQYIRINVFGDIIFRGEIIKVDSDFNVIFQEMLTKKKFFY